MTGAVLTDAAPHVPVMRAEVLAALKPADGQIYVDGTFGAGGYTRAILEAADCRVVAIDRDESARDFAAPLLREYAGRFTFVPGCFGDALSLVRAAGFEYVDGFVLDLGVSSMQIDQSERGFSFRFDGPLDMRMGRGAGPTAADIVNGASEEELIHIIGTYGQERFARKVAFRIVQARAEGKILTTAVLADIVRRAVPRSHKDLIDPATRTFQALRIMVNDELGELERGLSAAEALLRPGGRLVVVSFHSLEDGIVKQFMFSRAGRGGRGSRHLPDAPRDNPETFSLPSGKAIAASESEARVNPRARSAKLRAAVRTGAAA